MDDEAPKGSGFLSDVAEVWETGTQPAADAGVRVANLRFGVVLSNRGGVVQKLYWPYLFGLGGPVGPGTQYMSWVSLADAVRAVEHSIAVSRTTPPAPSDSTTSAQPHRASHLQPPPRCPPQRPEVEGPVNACAPQPCTSAEFAAAFGSALSRPAFMPLPTPAVRAVFGEMGEETLLVSQRAVPTALEASGFRFWYPDVTSAMRAAVTFHGGTEAPHRA